MILEICCGDIESVNAAVKGGADRVELCGALSEGGITPSAAVIRKAVAKGLPVRVLIRPRRGDFLYTEEEIKVMEDDIRIAVENGASGIVTGVLTPDGDVDVDLMKRLVSAANGLPVTFHRAFDVCRDPLENLERVIGCGCATLLTSGQAESAEEGVCIIRKLHEKAAGRIEIMAGSGVNPQNVGRIISLSGCDAVHGSASSEKGSMMIHKNNVNMGNASDEYSCRITDPEIVSRLRKVVYEKE